MTGILYGINYGAGWFISGWLGTGLDGDADIITLRLDKLI